MSDDFELLREHVERGSDEAFRMLVERHSAHARSQSGESLRSSPHSKTLPRTIQGIMPTMRAKANGGS